MNSNLEVWKLSHQLTLEVYKISNSFPKSEQFGLVSQVRRSAVEKRTGLKIACIEEIAFNFGWIKRENLLAEIKDLKGDYFDYLKKIIKK